MLAVPLSLNVCEAQYFIFDSFFSLLPFSIFYHPAKVLKSFEQKQDAMQKLLQEDRDTQRKIAEVLKEAVHSGHSVPEQKEQPEENVPPKKKKTSKAFPNSPIFKEWGENLSEDEQKEAQALFEKYGYNVFLSDRLPLDRPLPETRDPRYKYFLD